MRLRNFHKKIKKANDITGMDKIEGGSLAVLGAISGATLVATTSASSAQFAGANYRANTKLVIPTTPYTGANATYSSIYATGAYLFWSNGVAWQSGAGGLT